MLAEPTSVLNSGGQKTNDLGGERHVSGAFFNADDVGMLGEARHPIGRYGDACVLRDRIDQHGQGRSFGNGKIMAFQS